MPEAFIVAATRTAGGRRGGRVAGWHPAGPHPPHVGARPRPGDHARGSDPGTERALKKAGMKLDEIDLYEVNEAFACVPLAWQQALGADPQRMNVHGGAIALGHPLGASGTKLTATLVHAPRQRGGRFGLQTMCEGGGMANVTVVERL